MSLPREGCHRISPLSLLGSPFYLSSPQLRQLDDYAHIWLNGVKVYDNDVWTGGATTVTNPTDVNLGQGQNVLLFRCGEGGGSDYFNLHFEPVDADLEILPTMDEWEVFPREAVAVGLKAIEQGIARIKLSRDELYTRADTMIKHARDMTNMLMKQGFIPKRPAV